MVDAVEGLGDARVVRVAAADGDQHHGVAVALAFDAPAALQRALPNYTADVLRTDLAAIVARPFSALRLEDRMRVNDAVLSVLAPYAEKSDLDAIAAALGVGVEHHPRAVETLTRYYETRGGLTDARRFQGKDPVLSGPAVDNITDSQLDELVVTDTIPLSPAARACPKASTRASMSARPSSPTSPTT